MSDLRQTIEPTRPVPQRGPSEPVTDTDTCFVACKHGNGIVLSYFEPRKVRVATPSGTVEETQQFRTRTFTVSGPNNDVNPHQPAPPGQAMSPALVRFKEEFGGYAITPGCPRDVWKQWSKNHEHGLIAAGVIQAFSSYADAVKWCRGQVDVRSGLEPIDPEHPELTLGTRTRNALGGVSTIQPGSA
jgi:hypothetical protein